MRRPTSLRAGAAGFALLGLVGFALPVGPSEASVPLRLVTLSNRADLISSGDVLVKVVLPSGVRPAEVRVDAGGRDVTRAFAVRPDGGLTGLVTGLGVGRTVLTATAPDGSGARLTVTNHPQGGPVFAGPQVRPWVCTTASNGLGAPLDAQCDARSVLSYSYKSAVTGQFTSYDPRKPPPAAQVASTTTDQGRTVPYIIRDERGTLDRGIYDIAVLDDPAVAYTPWSPQPGWDHKLGFTFGGGCAPGHSQATAQSALDDLFLARGYMKAVSSLDVNGNSCNAQTSAESLMMIKEHITETYGSIRFTVGDGCSGGAEQQHMIADKYPGLLDGIRPECDFPDLWTPAIWEKYDCVLFSHYFDAVSPQLWAAANQRAAVLGGPLTPGDCAEQQAFNASGIGGPQQDWQPDGFGCALTTGVYNATTDRHGARCTLQDYNVNSLGRRPGDGFANRPIDNVGVQWGLAALQAGTITTTQFADLNAKIGDLNIDFHMQPQRAVGDVPGIRRMYQNDELSYGLGWAQTPEIDARADDSYDEHSNVMRFIDRARLDANTGNHDSQVFWTEPSPGAFGAPSSGTHALTLAVMDRWLTNIERDHRSVPRAVKVAQDKPALAKDGCFQNGMAQPTSSCAAVQTPNVLAVQVAGAPAAANVLKCQLKPLRRTAYTAQHITFSDADWALLTSGFPHGVCDWSKPGIAQQRPSGFWLSYSSGRGVPLGPAPVSVPFRASGRSTGPLNTLPRTGLAAPVSWRAVGCLAAALAASRGGRRRQRAAAGNRRS
ncbi:MAG: DUF6351 family protein [Mycobacteriales bacterium]